MLLVTILLFGGIAEIVAKVLVPAPLPWLWPQAIYVSSSSLGFRLKPLQSSYTADKAVQTNSMGLRGPEIPWTKPPGVRRVLILGDSVAFGYGVRYEDSFAHGLEERLNTGEHGDRYQVIDAGVPAFNTAQEVAYFREEGIRLQPDIVILAMFWNDVIDKSGVRVDDLGRLVEADAPREPAGYGHWLSTEQGYQVRNLLKRSNFLYFVVDRVRQLKSNASRTPSPELATQNAVLTGQPHAKVSKGWGVMEAQLSELKARCSENGIELLVALLPMPQLLGQHNFNQSQYPASVKKMCEKQSLNCLDTLPAFERQFDGHTSLFIPYDDHPNETGHKIIAESLHDALVARMSSR